MSRLNASVAAAVERLYEKNDCVLLLDDLFPTSIKEIKSQQEKTMTEMIRIIGDGSRPAKMKGNKAIVKPPRCGVIMTGEYDIATNPSTAARMLTVDFSTPIDSKGLCYFQNQSALVPTFTYYFLNWFIDNYNEIVCLLRELTLDFREHQGNNDIHSRLNTTYLCMETAHRMFLQYLFGRGYTTQEKVKEQHNSFKSLLDKLKLNQNRLIIQSEKRYIDYLKEISQLYRNNAFSLGKSSKSVKKHDYDGFVDDNFLYLRSDKLLSKVRSVDCSATLNKIKRELDQKGALKHHNGNKTVNSGNIRFYAIYLKALKK